VGDENPYESATSYNTSTEWLADQKAVDLDLDGMADYAQSMKRIEGNLRNELGYVDDLHQVPMEAWRGPVLGEAEYVRTRMGDNASELSQYIQRLGAAMLNVGMAAQTIADTYGSTDGWSAASLNAVRFAFVEYGATRPAGLPSYVEGKTYEQVMAEQAAASGGPTAQSPAWGSPTSWETRENADGSTSQIAMTDDGHRMVITTSAPGVHPAATTTTIYGPNGARISSSGTQVAQSSSSYHHSTTTTTTQDGRVTGSTTRSTVAGSANTETVVTHNADGVETNRRTVTTVTHDDGSQTVTTRNADGKVTDEVRVGPQTAGGPTGEVENTPYKRALDNIEGMY